MVIKIFTFIFYLATSVFIYLTTYGWAIEAYSVVPYGATGLGIGMGKLILLLVYCTFTFSTIEKLLELLQSGRFVIRLLFLLLGVLAIPISMVVVVLYNNSNYDGVYLPVDSVLNLVSLFSSSAFLNLLFFWILKFIEKRRLH